VTRERERERERKREREREKEGGGCPRAWMAMARGRKGGQRSGRAQSATRRRRYYEFSVKRAKPGCEGADMRRERTGKRKREKERENWRDEERGNH